MTVHVTHVGRYGLAELCACGCRHGSYEVLRLARVEIERTRDAVLEKSEVEAHVPRVGGLPLEVRHVSLRSVSLYPCTVDESLRTRSTVCVDRQVVVVAAHLLLTRNAVRSAQLEVAQHLVLLQELLVANGPAQTYRREGAPTVVASEARAAVATHCSRQQIASVERVVHTTVVGEQRVAVVFCLMCLQLVAGDVVFGRLGCGRLPVLVVVTDCCVYVALCSLEVMTVVGVYGEQVVLLLLRTVVVVVAAVEVVGCSIVGNYGVTLALCHVGSRRSVQLHVGEEVQLVVYIEVTDESSHGAACVVHVDKSARVALSCRRVDRIAACVERFGVSAQLVRARTHGQGGVERCGSPDSVAVVECVLGDRALGVERQLQMVVEEARVEHQTAREALRLVAAYYAVLVGVAQRSAERQTLHDVAREREVVVCRERRAVNLVEPVGVSRTEQRLLRIGAVSVDDRAELVGAQYVYHLCTGLYCVG